VEVGVPRLVKLLMLAVAFGVAQGAPCQTEPPTPIPEPVGGLGFVDEVEVTVVNVDVFVRDRDGKPVDGLGVSDFRVSQDGLEMPITHFAKLDREVIEHVLSTGQIEVPAEDATAPAVVTDVEIRPVFSVIYIDNENLNPIDRNRVLRRVREFVIDNLREPVQMMVVSYDRSLKVLAQFTDDSRAVTDALRGVTTVSGGRPDRDSDRQEILERLQEAAAESGASTGGSSSEGLQMRLRQQIMAYAEEEANSVSFTLQALREVMDMMSGLDGRKNIIYVSSGLPMTPGLGLMHEYASTFHDTAFMGRRTATDRTQAFQSLTSTANGQDISFYTIDASGLNPLEGFGAESRYGVTDPTASSVGRRNYQDSLTYMARYTGGLAIVNTNDISAGLELVRDDLFSYYSLGYTISATGQDRVHRIEVELPGRSEYELRYRRRYVEKSRETQVQDRVFTSLMVDVDDNAMELSLSAGARAPASADRWTVPLHASFPLAKIALVPEGDDYVGRLVLFLGARDVDGRQSEMQRQEHEIRIASDQYETAREQRFGIDVQLLLREGQHRVAVGLMDQLTRQAAYERLVVTVP
jgi:VWFA-related protein